MADKMAYRPAGGKTVLPKPPHTFPTTAIHTIIPCTEAHSRRVRRVVACLQ